MSDIDLHETPVQPDEDYGGIKRELLAIHAGQAEKVYPLGTTLYCNRSGCEHAETLTPLQFGALAIVGWPVHCGAPMQIGDFIPVEEAA